jgi:hypothetical protein
MPMHNDTSPAAAAVQLALLRNAAPARRYAIAAALSAMTRAMARRAIARAHPDLSPVEQSLFFVRVHYGRELADKLRADLLRRGHA